MPKWLIAVIAVVVIVVAVFVVVKTTKKAKPSAELKAPVEDTSALEQMYKQQQENMPSEPGGGPAGTYP